jgi:hypothetical protein
MVDVRQQTSKGRLRHAGLRDLADGRERLHASSGTPGNW